VAEYHGLLAGLSAYLGLGRGGPLTVIGDSQLIIGQMSGAMKAKQRALVALRDQAAQLAGQISRGVIYRWAARAQNTAADALASDGASTLPPPEARSYARGANVQTTPISAATRAAIVSLNANPAPGFRDFVRLAVGGADTFSARRLRELVIQAGPAAVDAVQAAFPEDEARQAAVLRWCLRGLAIELAVRKGQVDKELGERAG
jgi:hypothetical protein